MAVRARPARFPLGESCPLTRHSLRSRRAASFFQTTARMVPHKLRWNKLLIVQHQRKLGIEGKFAAVPKCGIGNLGRIGLGCVNSWTGRGQSAGREGCTGPRSALPPYPSHSPAAGAGERGPACDSEDTWSCGRHVGYAFATDARYGKQNGLTLAFPPSVSLLTE